MTNKTNGMPKPERRIDNPRTVCVVDGRAFGVDMNGRFRELGLYAEPFFSQRSSERTVSSAIGNHRPVRSVSRRGHAGASDVSEADGQAGRGGHPTVINEGVDGGARASSEK